MHNEENRMNRLLKISINVPAEVADAVTPILRAWSHLVPAWVYEINLMWADEANEGALSITAHYEYRRADLFVHPNFISHPERREPNLVHELMHIMTEPLLNVVCDLRDQLIERQPDLKPYVKEQIRYAVESVTCDLTAFALEHCRPRNSANVFDVNVSALSGMRG